jgi:hypothetical protein
VPYFYNHENRAILPLHDGVHFLANAWDFVCGIASDYPSARSPSRLHAQLERFTHDCPPSLYQCHSKRKALVENLVSNVENPWKLRRRFRDIRN